MARRQLANAGSPGTDGMTVEALPDHLRVHWLRVREELRAGHYQPAPVKRVTIPKPGGGERELGMLTVLDRSIQQPLLQVLQPPFDPTRGSNWKRGGKLDEDSRTLHASASKQP